MKRDTTAPIAPTAATAPAANKANSSIPTARQPRRMARDGKAADLPTSAPADVAPQLANRRPESKIAGVIALLQRERGATLAQLVAATGWQAHTTRAALTGLRKKGHTIEKTKRDDVTCYRIAGPA